MTLLDYQTTRTLHDLITTDESLPTGSLTDSLTVDSFTFVADTSDTRDADELDALAMLEAFADFTQFEAELLVTPPVAERLPASESSDLRTVESPSTPGIDAAIDLDGDGHADLSTAYARCSDGAGTLTHLFFSEDNFDLARAKAICGKCRLAPSCLAAALDREESYGVWGGELLVNGVIVAVKRGRGRPPKTPRVFTGIDEVPVPPHLVA